MAASPVEPRPRVTSSTAQGSPQAGVLALTASFATSQLAALSAFFGAIIAAYYSFQRLQRGLGIGVRECGALVIALLALLFFAHTLPTLLEKRRKARLGQITGRLSPGYFQLAPREEEDTFQRADGKHDEVLKWLRQPPQRVLYLIGSSGAGKSSLLTAWVQPKLERDGARVIRLRGYQDPSQALEDELKRPGAIWKRNPPETTDLNALFEEAYQRVKPARILVVLDQFEEFLILQEEQRRARFVAFLTAQAALNDAGAAILLVFRTEYDGFIQDLSLPTPIPGRNLQKVSAFTQRAAQDFLLGSGLKFEERLMADVLREAAEVEETKGLIRPVTLNLSGLVLARFATGLPRSFRPGRLIRGFVQEAVFQREVREASPILLPKLISSHVTKQPRTIDELAKDTIFNPRQVQGMMFKLSEPERGVVRALDPDYTVWELSHDFLVPMIDSILVRWRISNWRRVRPWLPLVYAVALLAVVFVPPRLSPDPIAELNMLGWTTRHVTDYENDLAAIGVEYVFSIDSIPPPESVHALNRVPKPFEVRFAHINSFDSAHFVGWSGLMDLRVLDLSWNDNISDFSALGNLPKSVVSLDLDGEDKITDADLKHLPGTLTSLRLYDDDRITDAGLKDLPRSLTSLYLRGADITDAALKDLPRSLISLTLAQDGRITDAGLKDLPRSLASLELDQDPQITDAGLKELPRSGSLTSLNLEDDTKITDAGLKDLPRSLTSLDLEDDIKITDAGLKDLPPSLTSINLGHTGVTYEGLKSLPATFNATR